MKIGIVTWFEYENYGTKLQAVALQKVLRQEGHDAYLINFNPIAGKPKKNIIKKILCKIKLFKTNRKKRMVISKFSKELEVKSNLMKSFIDDFCILTDRVKNENDYIRICNNMDLLIFGSDQIWNPDDFHKFYYADYDEIKTPRMSYAPSFGVDRLEENFIKQYRNALKRFSCITAREDSGVRIVREQLGLEAKRVVDPTVLISADEWVDFLNLKTKNEPYVVCYFLGNNKIHYKEAENFARKKNLKLKVIPGNVDSYDIEGEIITDAGPKEFVELIMNAKSVLTDSFHAMIFSLIFKKEFYIFYRFPGGPLKNENIRISQIVEEFNLHNNVVDYGGIIGNSKCVCPIDEFEEPLIELIHKSKTLLLKSVNSLFL